LHARGIQAYAWLEPPMVGLGLWAAHPECREKTRSGRDAVVDWRSLIALESPACFELAWRVWSGLLKDFDWDGVNVAELYFETGDANRETPFHPSALAEFGGDPSKDPSGFADWRTREVTLLNRELVTRVRALRPELDVELTVIDDQLDPALGRGVGSDVRALAQVAGETGATLQVEDPFTTWAQGPVAVRTVEREGLAPDATWPLLFRRQRRAPSRRPADVTDDGGRARPVRRGGLADGWGDRPLLRGDPDVRRCRDRSCSPCRIGYHRRRHRFVSLERHAPLSLAVACDVAARRRAVAGGRRPGARPCRQARGAVGAPATTNCRHSCVSRGSFCRSGPQSAS